MGLEKNLGETKEKFLRIQSENWSMFSKKIDALNEKSKEFEINQVNIENKEITLRKRIDEFQRVQDK